MLSEANPVVFIELHSSEERAAVSKTSCCPAGMWPARWTAASSPHPTSNDYVAF